jgi:sec-independent protein translocase protein TatC
MITIDNYLGFLVHTAIVFGLCFQMPVIISFLGMIGVVSQRFLREKRRYAIMVISIVAAIAAPPDAMSMILLLAPMIALYEISILVVGYLERSRMEDQA